MLTDGMMINETEYVLERYYTCARGYILLYVKPDAGDAADHRIYRKYRRIRRSDGLCGRSDEPVLIVLQAICRKSGGQAQQIQSISYRSGIYVIGMYRIYSGAE